MTDSRVQYKLFYRFCSVILIILHLVTFGPIRDAFAFNASSVSYKLNSGTLTQGGRDRGNNYTKLLLHCDGQDGSKVFTDSSTFKQTATPKGSPKITTAQSRFGGASAAFNGTTDYLTVSNPSDWSFGTGDFTIDFWVMFNTIQSCQFFGQGEDSANRWELVYYSSRLTFFANDDGNEKIYGTTTNTWLPSINYWYHIACVRNGVNFNIFIDGVPQAITFTTTPGNNDLGNHSADLAIGRRNWNSSLYLNGNIDEFRISKGIARWTSEFTRPNQPYDSTVADTAGSFKIWQDAIGESVGKIKSLSYILNSGFIPTVQTNPPVLTQDIPYQTWAINTTKDKVFDLDDYFSSLDGFALTYSVTGNSKITVSIDQTTHVVSFSQPQDWFGVEKVYFTATDTEGSIRQSKDVVLQVGNAGGQPNKPVILSTQITPSTIKEGDLVTLTIKAYDLDGDNLTFSYSDFFTETRQPWKDGDYWYSQATWQTDAHSKGHYTVRSTVSDGALNDINPIVVNIGDFNHPPVLDAIADITKKEGELVVITPHATDQDNDPITYYFSAPFDSQGMWQTDYDDADIYDKVQVTASDGIDTVSQPARVIIENTNRAPQVTLTLSVYTVRPNEQFSIMLSAVDPDGDSMTFSLKKDDIEIASGNLNSTYNTTTSFSDVRVHSISTIVTDSHGLSTPQSKGVDCADPNANRDAINPVMGDFNGDALTDLGLHNSDIGAWEICISDKGVFRNAVTWRTGFGPSKDWWPIGGDFDGNSKTDIGIYNYTTGELKVALSSGSAFGEPSSWLTFSGASYSWQPFTGNFNGDKYTDFAVYNKDTGEVRVALCTRSGFNTSNTFNTWLNNSDRDYIAMSGDFNGDSLGDLCLFKKSGGEFKVFFSNTSAFVDGSNWKSGFATDKDALISDFNNDGLTDIGWWDKSSSRWYYAISNGASFIDKGELCVFGDSSAESASTGDFNGDGITDLATFDRDQIGILRWNTQNSERKPSDLLVEIDNGIGGKTKIEYVHAASFDNDILPFPVYVVKSTALVNEKSQWETEEQYSQIFDYSGGYFDAQEREFRGFKKVTVTDPITGNYSQTYFYQGKPGEVEAQSGREVGGALKGQIERIRSFDRDGQQISETINNYVVKISGPSDRFLGFPALVKQTSKVWEENRTSLETSSEITYDNIGNALTQKNLGDLTKDGDEKLTETTYTQAYDLGFNRPLSTCLKDNAGNVVTKKTFEYYPTNGNLKTDTVYIYNPLTGEHSNSPTQYEYDPLGFGNLVKTTNALERSVTTTYETDFYTYPKTVTNDFGHTKSYNYDPDFGAVTSVTDANGKTSSTTYDSLGRVTEVRNALEEVTTTYSYPNFNTKVTTQGNLSKTEYIDGLGRKYKTVSSGEDDSQPRQVSTETYFNIRGLTDYETIAHYIDEDPTDIAYIRYEYDKRGRIISTTSDFPDTSKDVTATIDYSNPLYTETTDPKGHRKGTLKDIYGNVVEVTEFLSADAIYHTQYEYDFQNNLVKTTDDKGNTTHITYDSIGRKIKMIDPDMGTWNYEYDILGNLKKQTDAKGQVLEFEYDVLNRLTAKRGLSPQVTVPELLVTYIYDDPNKDNCVGRLSKVTDQSGSTEFFYDDLGREIKSVKGLSPQETVPEQQYVVERAYDTYDRLTKLTYPDGEEVNYNYDTNSGLLEKVEGLSPQGTVPYVRDISYNAKGQIKTIQYGNNTQTDYTYGNDLRLSRILTLNPEPGTLTPVLQDLNYDFDLNGNVSTLTDNIRVNTRSYTYDGLDRLTLAENIPDANAISGYSTHSFNYDSIGNMIYKSDVGVMTYGEGLSPQGTVPKPHALTSAGGYTYKYDTNGNMTVGKNKVMEYDIENRLTSVETGSLFELYTYDGDGGRVVKQTGTPELGLTGKTIYIGSLFEVTTDSQLQTTKYTKHIFAGANRVASVSLRGSEAAEAIYYHSDHLGSSNVISDQNGNLVERCEYTPYGTIGKHEGADVVKHKFTGKELDNTGLYFYGARYYDPEIGRFITADTIVQAPYDSQSLNRYSYCRNNPINYIDPTGHKWKWGNFFKAIGIAIVGIVLTIVSGGALTPFIGSYWAGIATGAFAGATIGGTFAAATGGNIGMGLLTGFVGGAVFAGLAPGLGTLSDGIFRGITLGGAAGPLTSGASMASNFVAGFVGGAASGAAVAGISGADVGQSALMGGAIAGGFSVIRDTAILMRAEELEQSRLDPKNSSGKSVGAFGDGRKLGGARYNPNNPYARPAPLGGHQGGQGKIFGFNYPPGSIPDRVIETWAGPHDWLNGWTYDSMGNLRNLNAAESMINTFTNPLNVALAAPIALPSAIPRVAYSAPAIIYGESQGN